MASLLLEWHYGELLWVHFLEVFLLIELGRKNTLIWIGVLYTISAIGSALANDPYTFAIFRFIGGLGVGASTIAAPAYISEIAPAKDRGKLSWLIPIQYCVWYSHCIFI